MELYKLNNSRLSVEISTFGAELKSLKKSDNGKEYMWSANPEYWKRTSPVLFPIVGSLNNGAYTYDGKTYPMSQHGFARDMEFEAIAVYEDELKFRLKYNDETLNKYPFKFELEIGYKLNQNNLTVSWRVKNIDDKEMYFSIGGHPAFMCPLNDGEAQTDYKLLFDTNDKLTASIIGNGGTLTSRQKEYALNDGYMDIAADLFDEDALIIENNQAHKVSLCTGDKKPYLTVSFTALLFGIWSPAKKNAPFVCIEPWYGRCDREGFEGMLSEREYGNKLAPSEEFYAEYTITAE